MFRIRVAGSSWQAETIGGLTTFLTMAYILFVNGAILAGAGLDPAQVLTVTALVAGVMTIAMGVVARYPFAIAPGMGINAAVAALVGTQGLSAPEAMGVVVAEGLVITLLVVTGVREAVLDAIPGALKRAIGAGIGLFLVAIGLASAGVIVRSGTSWAVGLGDLGAPTTLLFFAGLALALALTARKLRGALLIAMVAVTVAAIALGHARAPTQVFAVPDFGLVGEVSFRFVVELGALGAALAVFSLMLTDFFDTIGTAIGLGEEGKFLDAHGRLPRMRRVLLVDSLAAVAGGAASASSATTYIESASGIAAGARTGLASVITGALFLAAMFVAPLAGVVPAAATASALVVVGLLMARMLRGIAWRDLTESVPAVLCAAAMPVTWSISHGVGAGVIAHVVTMTLAGRARRVHPLVWGVAAAFIAFFALG